MSSWSGKTRGNIIGYRIFVFLLRFGGLQSAYFLLCFVALYFFLFSRKAFRFIYFYFHIIQGFSRLRSIRYVYQNFYLLGQVLIDKVAVLSGIKTNFTFDFEGEEYLHQMAAMGKGGVLMSAHVGNWDMAGQLLNRIKSPINILLLDAEHRRIKTFLDSVMVKKEQNRAVKIIVEKGDYSHLIEIKKAFSNNELLGLHSDRYLPGAKMLKAKLLGREAAFPFGPFFLALRFGVPVSFTFAIKESRNHYHFFATPGKIYPVSGRSPGEAELMVILNDYVTELEKILKKYPKQWFNYYSFWENKVS